MLLLSRLAEWLPERMQKHTAAPAEPEPVAPIAIMDPSNVNQIAVAREGVPLGGAQRLYMCTIVVPTRRFAIGVRPAMFRIR